MANTLTCQEKYNFDITPDYFKKYNIYPTSPKLCLLAFLNYEYYNEYIPEAIEN